jgi:hypothetical protein
MTRPTVGARDASLAPDPRSTYVTGADGLNSRLCRVQPPGAAPVPPNNVRGASVFPVPSRPAQRAAGPRRRFRAQVAPAPRSLSCSRGGIRHFMTDYFGRKAAICSRRALASAAPGRSEKTRRHPPPTCSDGPTLDAPDCNADQDPSKDRADAKRKLCASRQDGFGFGWAPRVAFRPSPHPRIRWTVASPGRATCACRHARPPPPRAPICPTRC